MQEYFYALAAFLQGSMRGGEQFTCWFSAEDSDFVRFNLGAIRQPGHVHQIYLKIKLIHAGCHANYSSALTGNLQEDQRILGHMLDGLRRQLPDLPEDPHLLIATEPCSTEQIVVSRLPETAAIVEDIMTQAAAHDFVGILAVGPVYSGFANSYGQRNWHETSSFNLDWSLFSSRDKAVKTAYAGFDWDMAVYQDKFDAAALYLHILRQQPVTLKLGSYPAYLTPTAFGEVISMLNWDGFSEKSLRTKQSSLRRMRDEGLRLNSAISLSENIAGGMQPGFQSEGFIKPQSVTLLEEGSLINSMISPRTAREYGIAANGANGSETLTSVNVEAGSLAVSRVLSELDTGIYISNLWYLNFSDRSNCRITGMTRFACFWVENGRIKAPVNVMRFDDSVFNLLGENLLGLTCERELLMENESYAQRSSNSALLPGALVKDFNFVL